MEQVSMIGIDLAKRSFSLHGARADGSVAFRRTLTRVLRFLKQQPKCIVEAQFALLGPGEATRSGCCRRSSRSSSVRRTTRGDRRGCPTMRFVAVKTEEQQSHGWHARSLAAADD